MRVCSTRSSCDLLARATVVLCAVMAGAAEGGELAGGLDVSASIAIVAGEAEPSVVFTGTNHGDVPVSRGDVAFGANRLMFLTPSGALAEYNYQVMDTAPAAASRPARDLRRGESAEWIMKLSDVLDQAGPLEAGEYRLFWEFAGVPSNELRVLQKAERSGRDRERRKTDFGGQSPRETLERLYRGIDAGDMMVPELLPFGDRRGEEGEFFRAVQGRVIVAARLMEVASRRFGARAVQEEDWGLYWTPARAVSLRGARVDFDDRFAIARVLVDGQTFRLRRERSSRWAAVPEDLFGPWGEATRARLQRETHDVEAIATAIERGEYRHAREAVEALRRRAGVAATRPSRPPPVN
jgi:hypothetical protein